MRFRIGHYVAVYGIVVIAIVSISLNVWGVWWGLPELWHPDEVVEYAASLLQQRTFNHNYFAYGSLPYFQVMGFALFPAFVVSSVFNVHDYNSIIALGTLIARSVSAVMGLGVVLAVYLAARELFGLRSALLSALLLALSAGFVAVAHFATTDIPSLFWVSLSFLASTYAFTRHRRLFYVLAGLCAGFAAAVKFVGVLAFIPLVAVFFLRSFRRPISLVLGLIVGVLGFLAVTPIAAALPCSFVSGVFQETLFAAAYNSRVGFPGSTLFLSLRNGLGIPLTILFFSALLYSIFHVLTIRDRRVLLVWSLFFPFLILLVFTNNATWRHTLLIIPSSMLLVGFFLAQMLSVHRFVWSVLVGGTVAFSLLYSFGAVLQFTHDSRVAAGAWLVDRVPYGTRLEVTSYVSIVPSYGYSVTRRPHNNYVAHAAALTQQRTARFVPSIYAVGEKLGVCSPSDPHYIPWYDRVLASYEHRSASFDTGLQGLYSRHPDYLFVSSLYTNRFFHDPENVEVSLFQELFARQTVYAPIARFHYQWLPWFTPRITFVNPTIVVFRSFKDNTP